MYPVSKVVSVIINATPNRKAGKIKTGVRIDTKPTEWWFYSFKHGTWTRHIQGGIKTYRTGQPIIGDDRQPERHPDKKLGPYKGDEGLKEAIGHSTTFPMLIAMRRTAV